MTKQRLEAFSDGVIAVVITIMVLELKVPHGAQLHDLEATLPVFLSYVLSYINVGIFWMNHHHMMHLTHHISGRILVANLVLLFWLSLIPFATAFLGENHNAPLPTAIMGVVLTACALSWNLVRDAIIAHQGTGSPLAAAIGSDRKSKLSLSMYVAAIPLAFVHVWLSDALYVAVAALWLVPDRRIEGRPPPDEASS